MVKSEFTEFELLAIEEHERDLQEEEISICQAIKEFGLDKFSRDRLEHEAAKNLLELNNLEDAIKLLSKSQRASILNLMVLRRRKARGGDTKSANDPKSKAIREIVKNWDILKAASKVKLAQGTKQGFLDAELKKYPSFDLDRKNIENQLTYKPA